MMTTPPACTAEERSLVTEYLRSTGGDWVSSPPDYRICTRSELAKKLEQVRDAVLLTTNAAPTDVEAAYEQSLRYVDRSFDFYEGKETLGGDVQRAFVVPMRSDRRKDSYASESIPFYPLLDPHRFGVASEIRMRALYGQPPTVLDTYLRGEEPHERGALVLAPLYADMSADVWSDPGNLDQALQLSSLVGSILADAVHFAHNRLGADYLGLGATLPHPNLTDFGRKIRAIPGMTDVTTTTGHGGTVYMIARTVRAVLEQSSVAFDGRIGVLGGAGSIGWSSIRAIRRYLPELRVDAFDKRQGRMMELVRSTPDLDRITLADNVADVLAHNRLVVSAITETVDLEAPEFADIDLTGTVWIDDSQPGSVDRAQLEARGGKVLWVAGQDHSATGFMTRDGVHTGGVAYTYGGSSGLYGSTTEFACGLEAAVVAASQDPANAVAGPVTLTDVERIGALFTHYGVGIAPFQSFGQPVNL